MPPKKCLQKNSKLLRARLPHWAPQPSTLNLLTPFFSFSLFETPDGIFIFLETSTYSHLPLISEETMASNPIFAILWLALLWFIAWPVAGLCAGFWILLQVRRECLCHCSLLFLSVELTNDSCFVLVVSKQPFEACFSFLNSIQNFLERLITWPRDLGHAIKNCQSSFPAP
jgi:hypothetical protein